MVTDCFSVNFSAYKSQLLRALDASRGSLFHSRLILTACCMTEILHNKLFYKKERREDDEFCTFNVERFRTLAIALQVIIFLILLAMLKITGLSLCISKMNLSMGVIRVYVVIHV